MATKINLAKTYTIWRKEGTGYKHIADIAAPTPEQAWRTAAKTQPPHTRLIVTAEGPDRPPSLSAGSPAGLCEGVT